ncbi:class I adenylate-forming enzyme family protein [Nocardia rhamnosiphila]
MTADTFCRIWDETVRAYPAKPFLLFRDESGAISEWTYAEFDTVVARTAGLLRDHGVGVNAPVHIVLRNCPAFVAVWLAVARIGAWIVPIDPASASRDIANQVTRVHPALGIVSASRACTYREGASGKVPVIIELAEDATDVAVDGPLHGDSVVESASSPADRLAVMFTSGTTSAPKGVILTQANYAVVATTMANAVDLQPRHRWHVTLPLFHANAQYYCIAPAIAVGASVALSAVFSASGWVPHARELGVTHASLFAAPIRMILNRCAAAERPLELEHVWFAQSLGAQHYEQFAVLAGTRPRQLYGMTETVSVVCTDTSRPYRHDVIGTPLPDRRLRIEDPTTGHIAAPGVPGELSVLGTPGVDIFARYLDDEATTRRAFRATSEGTWFNTGDLVCADPDGVLRFVGRVDDVVKVSGENVSLTEIEATVAQAPGVLEVAVVAEADPIRDVVPVAYFVARDPSNPPLVQELTEWAARALSPAARPRQWHLIDELPRTSVGKIRRFRIQR